MKRYLLPKDGQYYKVNLHCHTNLSDGKLDASEIKELYKARGYSAVAFTDHDLMIPHGELTDSEFVALTGVEYEINQYNSYPGKRGGKTCHICFIAPDEKTEVQPLWNPRYAYVGKAPENAHLVKFDANETPPVRDYSPEFINETVRVMRERGFFVTYNHPTWSLEGYAEYGSYRGFSAMEIFNYGADRLGIESYEPDVYDAMVKTLGVGLYAVATDDNHNKYPENHPKFDTGGGFVMVKAEKLTYGALMSALHRGDFYASRGPLIEELYAEDGVLHVKCSGAKEIRYNTQGRNSRVEFASEGELITSAEFEILPHDGYFRITVRDESGATANTSAYSVEGLVPDQD